ncbi:MAG: DNA-binding response regulator [Deltaproteobacteria bacterium]|nr:MAG: DNA-binding response regulator [Deltaproteobacteria bacterium]
MDTILIVDDEKNYPLILSAVLEEEGYETLTANDARAALDILSRADIDLILTDMKMPGMDGIALLEEAKELAPDVPVILMTAYGTIEKAVEAMQKGAYTYILKPFDNDSLIIHVEKAMDLSRVVRENRRLRDAVSSQFHFDNIVGKSQPMQLLFDTIRKVAPASASILIEGESGTGKELVAQSIHFNSPRREQPFVAVNCAALSESLLESELFGHEKGAFTGAATLKKGRFELADGGTLFLDEIGELSSSLQVKLLRVLQERNLERVGGVKTLPVDFRLIAATNRHLADDVAAGTFREDLFYRLNVVHLNLPPLRSRSEDLHLLAMHFIRKYEGERAGNTPITGLSPEARRLIYAYAWPGNVRELENVMERAMVLASGPQLTPADFPLQISQTDAEGFHLSGIRPGQTLTATLAAVEKEMILQALDAADQIQSHAAERLGITKSGLNQKIKKYGIRVSSKK